MPVIIYTATYGAGVVILGAFTLIFGAGVFILGGFTVTKVFFAEY